MLDLIIQLVASLIALVLAYMVGKQGKISLIHTYHYKHVKEADKGRYTNMVGRGLSVIGYGVALCGLFNYSTGSEDGLLGLVVCIVYGLIKINQAQKLYNEGKWFS